MFVVTYRVEFANIKTEHYIGTYSSLDDVRRQWEDDSLPPDDPARGQNKFYEVTVSLVYCLHGKKPKRMWQAAGSGDFGPVFNCYEFSDE